MSFILGSFYFFGLGQCEDRLEVVGVDDGLGTACGYWIEAVALRGEVFLQFVVAGLETVGT